MSKVEVHSCLLLVILILNFSSLLFLKLAANTSGLKQCFLPGVYIAYRFLLTKVEIKSCRCAMRILEPTVTGWCTLFTGLYSG